MSTKHKRRTKAGSRNARATAARRTRTVWAVFVGAMTGGCGLLLLADGSLGAAAGAPMLGPGVAISHSGATPLFDTHVTLDESRWRGIVVHHSGSPAGSAASLHRQHLTYGLDGLGYHFVIGNGDGAADGEITMGYRWQDQLPGAHAVGPDGEWHNEHSIAICLVGNGETRPFTARQVESLISLVTELQRRMAIPTDRVRLHRDVADVRSPGRFFAEAAFRERLLAGSG